MPKYAENTTVSPDRSRAEIEKTLARYGATGFMYGWSGGGAVIGFVLGDRQYRLMLQLPDRNERAFTHTEHQNRRRTSNQAEAAYEQAVRQKWRALALVIKAKLEAVESGISTVESEFLAWTVLPGNTTVGEWLLPQLDQTYQTGSIPKLLPIIEDGEIYETQN